MVIEERNLGELRASNRFEHAATSLEPQLFDLYHHIYAEKKSRENGLAQEVCPRSVSIFLAVAIILRSYKASISSDCASS